MEYNDKNILYVVVLPHRFILSIVLEIAVYIFGSFGLLLTVSSVDFLFSVIQSFP
jgi:hypothetical protein